MPLAHTTLRLKLRSCNAPPTSWRAARANLVCSALLVLGLAGCHRTAPPPVVVHDSNVPIPTVYDRDGHALAGYQGYSDGFVTTVLKACLADAPGLLEAPPAPVDAPTPPVPVVPHIANPPVAPKELP